MTTPINTQNKSWLNGRNLLDNKLINNFLRSRWFPGIIQWPTLIIFMVIMFELILGPEAAHDNFGTALTWVLWRSESSEPLCEVEELPLSVLFTGKLLLRAAAGEVTEVAVKGVSAPYSAIVRQALEKGILVHGARLQLNHGEQTFEVTLDAEFFDFKSAKLPQLLQEEEAEQRIERLELVGRLGRLVDALISEFTAVRLSPGWKKTVVPQIRQWLDQNAA